MRDSRGNNEGDYISVTGFVLFHEETGPPTALFQVFSEGHNGTQTFSTFTPHSAMNLTCQVYFSASNLQNTTHTLIITLASRNEARFYLDSILASSGLGPATTPGNVLVFENAVVVGTSHSSLAGAVIGGAVGGACFVIVAALLYCLFRLRRRGRRSECFFCLE